MATSLCVQSSVALVYPQALSTIEAQSSQVPFGLHFAIIYVSKDA